MQAFCRLVGVWYVCVVFFFVVVFFVCGFLVFYFCVFVYSCIRDQSGRGRGVDIDFVNEPPQRCGEWKEEGRRVAGRRGRGLKVGWMRLDWVKSQLMGMNEEGLL